MAETRAGEVATEAEAREHDHRSRVTFGLIWTGLVVSLLGDQVYRVSLAISLSHRGTSALASLGLVIALPTALFGLMAGVFIDRSNKLRLLIGTDATRAVIVGVLGALFIGGTPALVPVLAMAALLSVASVFFTPALQAMMPELSRDKARIIAMDVWILGAIGAVSVIGPATTGLLLQVVSPQFLIWFDAATFCWSALMVALAYRVLRPTARPTPVRPPRARISEVREGMKFLMGHPVLRACFTTFPVMEFVLYSVPFLLPALLAGGSAGRTATWYGLCLAALGGGRLCGLVLVKQSRLKNNRGWILRVNFFVQAVGVLVLATTGTPVLQVAGLGLTGVASGAAQVAMSSYMQIEVAPEMRGRVFSSMTALVTCLQPFGALVFGAIAALAGVRVAFVVIGGVLLAGALRLFFARQLALVQ